MRDDVNDKNPVHSFIHSSIHLGQHSGPNDGAMQCVSSRYRHVTMR